jgi:mono/diheme cytochrome c family protein
MLMLRHLILSSLLALSVAGAASAATAPQQSASVPYTPDQARAGKAVYDQSCAKCHGATLTGGSAPNLVGQVFTASGLTVGALHTTITQSMPMDAPASLSAEQYASVIAYLLAVNCYPAGTTPFPASGPVPNRKDKVATQGSGKACALPAH